MQTEIEKTIAVLKNGGLILYPTDTIWGIGCDATNNSAVKKIFDLKKREDSKAMISLVKNTEMIDIYTDSKQLNFTLTKHPTTVIYQNVSNIASNLIAEDKTSAFRIPNNKFCQELLTKFGLPIVSTSANISGYLSPTSFSEIAEEIKNNVDYIVNLHQEDIMDTPSKIIYINKDGSIKTIRE